MISTNPEPLINTAKVIIIGDAGAGKTSVLIRFCQRTFHETVQATIGFQFLTKTVNIDGENIKINVWDTAGQEQFQSLTQTFFQGAHGVIFTYSINDINSFRNLEKWINMVNNNGGQNIPKVLVGNKNDVDEQFRKVSFENGRIFAQECGMKFFETTAKADCEVHGKFHIDTVFETLARDIKEAIFDRERVNRENGFRLTNNNNVRRESGCCS